MPLEFDPPLQSSTEIHIQASFKSPVTLRLHATLSLEEWTRIEKLAAIVQLWSNLPSSETTPNEWHALSFKPIIPEATEKEEGNDTELPTANRVVLSLDLPLANGIPGTQPTQGHESAHEGLVTLQATLPISIEHLGFDTSYQYTYRILYPDGGIDWQGTGPDSNGIIVFKKAPEALKLGDLDWNDDPSGFKRCVIESDADNVVVLNMDYKWSGWGISETGTSTFELPSDIPRPSTLFFVTCAGPTSPYIKIESLPAESFIIHIAASASLSLSSQGGISVNRGEVEDDTRFELEIYPADAITELFNLMSLSNGSGFPVTLSWSVLSHNSPHFLALFSPPDRLIRRVQMLPLQPSTSIPKETVVFKADPLLEGMGKYAVVCNEHNQNPQIFDASTEEVAVQVGGKGGTFKICPCYDLITADSKDVWVVSPLDGGLDAPPPATAMTQAAESMDTADDPELMVPTVNPSSSNAMILQTDHPFLASAAYIALILTILLAYIAPNTSSRYRRKLTGAMHAEKRDKENKIVETRSTAPAEKENGNIVGEKLHKKVTFDLLESGGPPIFYFQKISGGSDISRVEFRCEENDVQPTIHELREGSWIVTLGQVKGPKLEIWPRD